MIDFAKLISPPYILDQQPASDSNFVVALAIIFGVLVLISGLLQVLSLKKVRQEPVFANPRSRLTNWLFSTGFVGLILIFFRWQSIPYFASRIVLIVWLLISLIWLIFLIIYLLKKFPKERMLEHERLIQKRYLPKSKNR